MKIIMMNLPVHKLMLRKLKIKCKIIFKICIKILENWKILMKKHKILLYRQDSFKIMQLI